MGQLQRWARRVWRTISELDTASAIFLWIKTSISGGIALMLAGWAWLVDQPVPYVILLGIIAFTGVIWAINGIFWLRYQKIMRDIKIKETKTPEEPESFSSDIHGSHVKGQRIRLTELFQDSQYVTNKIFEDCEFYGFAVISFVGRCVITEITFAAGPEGLESILIEIPEHRKVIMGVVGFKDCIIRRCSFVKVGVIGHPLFLNEIRAKIVGPTNETQTK